MSARRFKPYPAYKDSGVEWLGEIPVHWDAAQMWRISDATSGGTPAKEDLGFWDGDIPWVSPKDMKRRFIDSSEDTITERAVRETGIKLIAPPVVLIVVRGMILAHTFPVAITTVPVTINQDMKALRFRQAVEPIFAAWLFEGVGRGILGAVVEEAAHGTRVIRMDRWRTVVALVPPIGEQRAIAAFLDRETARIDALVVKKERLIELLQEQRTALITRAVTKGLPAEAAAKAGLDPNVPMKDSGVEWLGEIPAHWDGGKLRRFWSVIDCKHRTATYVVDGVPIVSTTEVKPGRLALDGPRRVTLADFEELTAGGRRPRQGDLIYSRNASLGSAAYVGTDEPFCMGQDVCLITSDSDQLYLGYQLNSPVVLAQIEAVSVGSTFERINIAQIKDFMVASPSAAEQGAIAAFLDRETARIDALVSKVGDAIDRLTELRTALISAAVTGKIDVRGASAETSATQGGLA